MIRRIAVFLVAIAVLAAFATGDYRLNMKPAEGQARRDRGKFIFILRTVNGRWLLDHLMFSSDFGPEGGPPVG